jgi:phage FluMu gp28-like protein
MIKLYTPHTTQKPVHEFCNDKETFFITVDAGRQSGKTALSQQQALYWALKNSKVLVYWVSPTNSQANKVYKQLVDMVAAYPFVKNCKGSVGDLEIEFKNGSVIKFRSAAQEDSLRGETVDYLIIDEAAFIKESVFQEILLPMLNIRGKKCLIISTPKGKNWFFYQYMRGLETKETKYKSFKFTSADNPYSNPDIIQLAKESLPSVLFAQEYLGEFVDSSAIFENIPELCILERFKLPRGGEQYFIGVDIALKNDYTVATVINHKGEVVDYLRFKDVSSPELKRRLLEYFKIWKPKKIMIEANNQGQPIIDDLKIVHKITNIVGFNTTATSKPEIVNNLINAFSSKKLTLPKDEEYKGELEVFTMTLSATGKPKFEAPQPFNDDIPMSLAITWECLNKYRYNGSYNFM